VDNFSCQYKILVVLEDYFDLDQKGICLGKKLRVWRLHMRGKSINLCSWPCAKLILCYGIVVVMFKILVNYMLNLLCAENKVWYHGNGWCKGKLTNLVWWLFGMSIELNYQYRTTCSKLHEQNFLFQLGSCLLFLK